MILNPFLSGYQIKSGEAGLVVLIQPQVKYNHSEVEETEPPSPDRGHGGWRITYSEKSLDDFYIYF